MKITLGNTELAGSSRLNSCIVDSGTTFTYIPSSTHRDFETKLKSHCSQAGNCPGAVRTSVSYEGVCYELNGVDPKTVLDTLPVFSLHLNGYKLDMPGSQYMFLAKGSKTYCAGFYNNGPSSTVIGGNAMQRHDVVFDGDSNRIGFAKANCDPQNAESGEKGDTTAPTDAPTVAKTVAPTAATTNAPTAATTNAPTAATTNAPTAATTERPTNEPTTSGGSNAEDVGKNTDMPTSAPKKTASPTMGTKAPAKSGSMSLLEKLLSNDKSSVAIIFSALGSLSTIIIFTASYLVYARVCGQRSSSKYARLGQKTDTFEELDGRGVAMVTI